MSEHLVALFDAFTDKSLGGSVAAMFDDASNLSAEQMQKIAREFGAPATCFVTSATDESVYVRFFSTMTEYPMCGHGTMGLMTWLVDRGVVSCDRATTVALHTPAASSKVDLRRLDDGRVEVMLGLAEAQFDTSPVDRSALASALGIDVQQFSAVLPVELSRSDFVSLLVPLGGLSDIRTVTPDFGALSELCRLHQLGTIAIFSIETEHPNSTIHCREFAPYLGTPEAPASGTTNRANACYLLRHNVIDTPRDGQFIVVVEQGYEMGRPSEILVELTFSAGALEKLRVGGIATMSLQGQFFLG